MRAMVLAAGLGTRLRPLTLERPKPAVPLAFHPLGAYALDHLARSGILEVAMNSHHLPEVLREQMLRAVGDRQRLHFLHEPELLGTGGGIRNAAAFLLEGEAEAPVIVMNGDILFAPALEGALALHRAQDAIATMILRADPRADRLGSIEIDAQGRVRRMLGEPGAPPEGERMPTLRKFMFTGVHILSPRAFRDLPERGCIVRRSYRRWIDEGDVVTGFVDDSPWMDLGTPEAYLRANLELASGRLPWPGVQPGAGGSLIHPEAEVGAGAEVIESVVGPGARVDPGLRLERCVLWAGASAQTDLRQAIVGRTQRLTLG
ncbi:MAG: NDP-sugar synthase [Myxococcales bacterium]|nr:NDP-sugar synthase [Myxococcales bacterium]